MGILARVDQWESQVHRWNGSDLGDVAFPSSPALCWAAWICASKTVAANLSSLIEMSAMLHKLRGNKSTLHIGWLRSNHLSFAEYNINQSACLFQHRISLGCLANTPRPLIAYILSLSLSESLTAIPSFHRYSRNIFLCLLVCIIICPCQ